MKQKDLALIIGIAGFSVLVAFVLANILIGTPENRQTSVKTYEAISSDFPEADKRYFNDQSINPTQTVQIGGSNNPLPFQE